MEVHDYNFKSLSVTVTENETLMNKTHLVGVTKYVHDYREHTAQLT
jgi:hypothetical protein